MKLNLHEIIHIPGRAIPFSYTMDLSDYAVPGITEIRDEGKVEGSVRNEAGMLVFSATLTADMVCQCARCAVEFERHVELPVNTVLAEELQDEDNPDIYLLEGDDIDVDEVIVTAFVLDQEQRFLCRPDCKGLCPKCGKNLNDGPCECKDEPDPRLAKLAKLLEND